MFQDMDILCIGVAVMVFYVQFVISKFNCVEARVIIVLKLNSVMLKQYFR